LFETILPYLVVKGKFPIARAHLALAAGSNRPCACRRRIDRQDSLADRLAEYQTNAGDSDGHPAVRRLFGRAETDRESGFEGIGLRTLALSSQTMLAATNRETEFP
jgi:hypothetical protein